jgi:hypothetical protein
MKEAALGIIVVNARAEEILVTLNTNSETEDVGIRCVRVSCSESRW